MAETSDSQGPERAVEFFQDLGAPQRPVGAGTADLKQNVARPARNEDTGVEERGEHDRLPFRFLPGGLECRFDFVGLCVVETEALGIDEHVGERELCCTALTSAVLDQVV